MVMSGLVDATRYYLDRIGTLPPDSFIEFRYEDFCLTPGRYLDHIAAFLDLDLGDEIRRFTAEPRDQPVLPAVRRAYDRKAAALAPYLMRFGYDRDPDAR